MIKLIETTSVLNVKPGLLQTSVWPLTVNRAKKYVGKLVLASEPIACFKIIWLHCFPRITPHLSSNSPTLRVCSCSLRETQWTCFNNSFSPCSLWLWILKIRIRASIDLCTIHYSFVDKDFAWFQIFMCYLNALKVKKQQQKRCCKRKSPVEDHDLVNTNRKTPWIIWTVFCL